MKTNVNASLDVLVEDMTSMYWAGRSAYQAGLTMSTNPWDSKNPSEVLAHRLWRNGFVSAERDALARIGGAK